MEFTLLLLLTAGANAADVPAVDKKSLVAKVLAAPTEAAMKKMNEEAASSFERSAVKADPVYSAWWEAQKAAEELARRGNLAELRALSRDRSPVVAAAAVEGLREAVPSARVVGILRGAIKRGGRPRDEALSQLYKQGPAAAAAVPELLGVARKRIAERQTALRCLKDLGPAAASAVPELSKLMAPGEWYLDDIADTLAALGPAGAKTLAKAMASADEEVRTAAYRAGRDLKDPDARAAARKLDYGYTISPP